MKALGERKWIIMGAVARALRRQPVVSADDLHEELGPLEYPWDRRAFGAVLRSMAAAGILVRIGYRPSRRRECHGRPVLEFRENGVAA